MLACWMVLISSESGMMVAYPVSLNPREDSRFGQSVLIPQPAINILERSVICRIRVLLLLATVC